MEDRSAIRLGAPLIESDRIRDELHSESNRPV